LQPEPQPEPQPQLQLQLPLQPLTHAQLRPALQLPPQLQNLPQLLQQQLPAAAAAATAAAAARPPAATAAGLACAGEWRNRGKQIQIAEKGGTLVLEMGTDAPTLRVVPASPGEESWPMRWHAVRADSESKDPLYILELPELGSSRLFVRRRVGDGVVEFLRVGDSAHQAAKRSRSRSRSRSPSRRKEGSGFLPGDWNCPRCGDHQFARNLSCRSCGASKPGGSNGAAENDRGGAGREGLISQIKKGQRESLAFKEQWWDFCDRYGHGFYDPVRHETRFLEDFLDQARDRNGRGRSRSGSRSRSRSSSTSRRRSRTRSRTRRRRRRRRAHRHKRKCRRRRTARRRPRSKSGSSASSSSTGLSPQEKELRAAEAAAEEADRELAKAKLGGPDSGKVLQGEEEKQKEEVIRLVAKAREDAEADLTSRLHEAEEKLRGEKTSRLREAEQRLDKAIAARLREAEKRLRCDAEMKIEEAHCHAEENARHEVAIAERRAQSDAAAKVEEAEARLSAAKARLASLKAAAKGSCSDEDSNGSGGSDSSSGSES